MARPTINVADKLCEFCKKPFNRTKHSLTKRVIESARHFAKRRFCGTRCSNGSLRQSMSEKTKAYNDRRLARKYMPRRTHEYLEPVAPKIYDPEDVPEYIDPDLAEYTEKVKRIVEATKEPFTYGYIHRMLGDDARRDLTPTVLTELGLVCIPGYLERFWKSPVESKWAGNLDEFGKSGVRGSRWVRG